MLAGPALQDAIAICPRASRPISAASCAQHARFGTAQWHAPDRTSRLISPTRAANVTHAPASCPSPAPARPKRTSGGAISASTRSPCSSARRPAFGQLLDPCGGQRRPAGAAPARPAPRQLPRRPDAHPARFAAGGAPQPALGGGNGALGAGGLPRILARLSGSRLRAEFEQHLPRAAPGRRAHGAGSGRPAAHPARRFHHRPGRLEKTLRIIASRPPHRRSGCCWLAPADNE